MKEKLELPEGFACPSYSSLYPNPIGEYPENLLQGMPLYDTIFYVIERQAKIQYNFGDQKGEMNLIYEMCCFLDNDAKIRMNDLIASNPNQYLFSNMSTLNFIMLALQKCDWEVSRNLSVEEKRSIYKVYLYCNEEWTSKQEKGISALARKKDLLGMYFMADVPIVEFKSHKDFRPQLFKAGRLFHFMESNDPYADFLRIFLEYKKATSWQDYLMKLFSFYSCTLDKAIVKIEDKEKDQIVFFNNLSVKKDECNDIWDGRNLKYLREHPLLKVGNYYFALNPNFLIDMFYQGVKFDIFNAIKDRNPLNKKGKIIKDFGEFASMLGNDFSEKEIFYRIMNMAFDGIVDVMKSGFEMDSAKVLAPSDFYIRINKSVYLFEYKDVMISDNDKYSYDYSKIKSAMLNKVAKDDGRVRKGLGQLLFSINEAVNNKSLSSLDPEISNASEFYPIIVTTDRTFSSLGFQYMLVEACGNLIKNWKIPVLVKKPMVLDLDTLFLMTKRLHDRAIDFHSIINEYLNLKDFSISSFDTFYSDHYQDQKILNEDDIKFLFEDVLKNM